MKTTISLWERFKRIVAHAFDMETRREIQEKIEQIKFEDEQAELRLEHRQHIRSLMIEYAAEIEAYQLQKQLEENAAKEEVKRKERIELHKTNNWDKYLSSNPSNNESEEQIEE